MAMTRNPAAPSGSNVQEIAVSVEKLLPCPFCAEQPAHRETIEHYNDDDGAGSFSCRHSIECDNCGLQIAEEYEREAVAAWNRRAPALRQQESRAS